jgi:hypothetical protein
MPSQTTAAERWERAICVGMDNDEIERVFFRGTGRPPKNAPHKKICGNCPIRQFCLEYGIVHEETGVWGGQTQAERNALHPIVRQTLVEKAKAEGWYEDRVSIDELVSVLYAVAPLLPDDQPDQIYLAESSGQPETQFRFDFEVETVAVVETADSASSEFFFDFETAS